MNPRLAPRVHSGIATACLFLAAANIVVPADSQAPEAKEQQGWRTDPGSAIGVTHVAGKYHLTDKDFLNEGADRILDLGSRAIKIYLSDPPHDYPFNTSWEEAGSLVDMARSAPYKALFEKPFETYIITTYARGRPQHYWRSGVSDEARRDEARQFRELARHFLETYAGTGKTFVLQHWEGDWAIRGSFDRKAKLDETAVRGMIDWLDARQAGVDEARAEVEKETRAQSGAEESREKAARVLHATEVNLVVQAMRDGMPGVANRVVPHTSLDLVSYSAWDAQEDRKTLREALDFIEKHLPPKAIAGSAPPSVRRRVYIGEFGAPENDFEPERLRRTLRGTVETGLEWGCPWVVYWQVYCNEARKQPVTGNADVRGFWLLRPDGSRAWAWDYLKQVLEGAAKASAGQPQR